MNKFKVGDVVRFIDKVGRRKSPGCFPPVGTVGKVTEFDEMADVYTVQWFPDNVGYQPIRASFVFEERIELVEHSGKILIMRDKKDPMRVIARDLDTNKTAEARCNPQDTFKFETGARLALDRLFVTEPPEWNGRITPVDAKTDYWTNGRIYEVKDGVLCDNDGDTRFSTEQYPVESFVELQSRVPFKILEIKD